MGEQIVKLTPMQGFIANKMRETVRNCPQAVTAFDIDMGPILALKDELAAQGQRVTIAAFLVKATSLALQRNPKLNSRIINNEIHLFDEVNLGIAMSVADGLIVPVIRNTQQKSCPEISRELKTLKEKFEQKTLKPEDMQGATATISSLGVGKNQLVLPILNDDQCLLLGAGSIRLAPAVMEDGSIGVKNIATVSVTTNHCIVYGADVGNFCSDFAEIAEHAEEYLK